MADYSHVEAANGYARDVVAGKIPANKRLQKACKRHLDDLKKSRRRAYPYKLDVGRAEDPCRFGELFKHVKGKWARRKERIKLQPWQSFILVATFGWVKKSDGTRRFRRVYIEVPRKNGKSLLAAIVALYMLAADEEAGAEVYSGATTEKQAWEVFRPARQMAMQSASYQEAFGVEVTASKIWIPSDGSWMEPVIGKPGDGASPHCAIIDELHEHQTDDLYDTMLTGMGAREQPLLFAITTAGKSIAGPCWALREEVCRVLDGTIPDDELLGLIWGLDDDEDWTTDEAIYKANPNVGVSVSFEYLKAQQRSAINSTRRQATVKTKHFNVWVTSRSAWLNMEDWKACEDTSISLERVKGEPCMVGLDLASKIDMAARAAVFKVEDEYWIFGRYWVPEDRVDEVETAPYKAWVADGHLDATEGNVIDYDEIEDDLRELRGSHQIEGVPYDPHQATKTSTDLRKEGFPMVEVRQQTANYNGPMKEFEALVAARKIKHNGDPVLAWMFSNVEVKPNAKEEIFPRKARPENKIDGAIATLLAFSRWMAKDLEEGPKRSVYEDRGLV